MIITSYERAMRWSKQKHIMQKNRPLRKICWQELLGLQCAARPKADLQQPSEPLFTSMSTKINDVIRANPPTTRDRSVCAWLRHCCARHVQAPAPAPAPRSTNINCSARTKITLYANHLGGVVLQLLLCYHGQFPDV